jgi:hypothetical protein
MDMKTALWVIVLLSLSACGPKKSGPSTAQETLQSRSGGTLSGNSVAKCNLVSVPNANAEGVLKAYWTGSAYEYDRVLFKFTRTPATLTSTASISMKVMRWGYNGSQQFTNGVPAPLKFYLNSAGVVVNENSPVTDLSLANINNAIVSYGLGQYGVTVANFFQKISIVIDEVDMSYDALTFNFYDSSRGNSVYASGNSLIPAFHANPNTYAQQNPAPALQALHPHYANRNAGWSNALYASYFDQLCSL